MLKEVHIVLLHSVVSGCDLPDSSDVTPPHSIMPNLCILANCLVKGQWAFENETHIGCSLDVLKQGSAY